MQIIPDLCDTALTLTVALDNTTADEVRKALLAHLEHHARILLDLSQIDICDAVGVQLLLAMQKSAHTSGKLFAVVAVADVFTKVCTALGIPSGQFEVAPLPFLEPRCTEKENTVA